MKSEPLHRFILRQRYWWIVKSGDVAWANRLTRGLVNDMRAAGYSSVPQIGA